MENTNIDLMPYLQFNGNCEEALNNYAKILNGKVEIVQRYNNPAMKAPKEYQDKVLHGSLKFGKHVIYASDAFPGKTINRGNGDTALSLSLADPGKGKEIFDKLAESGEVHVPYEKQFWGDWHGNLRDRFGIRWMVNCEQQVSNKTGGAN